MAAVPAGYEAFHSLRRKSVTLLCFLLASTMTMGITVYVDSYSVHEWDKNLDVGEVAIIISGEGIESYVSDIRAISAVTKAENLRYGYGQIQKIANESQGQTGFSTWGQLLTPSQEFLDTFPNHLRLVEGRMPENLSEILINNAIRAYFGVELGEDLILFSGTYTIPVKVIGFYKHGDEGESPYYWTYDSAAIVMNNAVQEYNAYTDILADIDRTPLTAFNPYSSLGYLNGIDQAIRNLDPYYDPVYSPYSRFGIQNRLASGIYSYIYWVQGTRTMEMLRASGIMLLVVLVTFLAIRHNVNERRFEEGILLSRGASKGDLEKIVTREIFILSVLSFLLGIPLGLVFSRVAIAATSFFTFNLNLFITEPFLVSLESLIIAIVVGLVLPMLTLGCYRAIYSTKKRADEERGKLAKVSKGLTLIRWDLFIVVMAGLLLLALITGGPSVASNPLLSLLIQIVPLPLFIGFASLSIKTLRRFSNSISKVMKKIVGDIPSSIGIRRVGKEASSAGAAAMVLVLAISLSWNCAIIDASLPITAQYQAQLAIGADLSFRLDSANYETWDEFITNVTAHELVLDGTVVSTKELYLSADYGGLTDFLAVKPREYSRIGYDYLGSQLNESEISDLMEQLQTTLDGAIITSDIAAAYNLASGDILRASTMASNAFPVAFRILGIVDALPEMQEQQDWWFYDLVYLPALIPYYYWGREVGKRQVLVNRDYFGTKFNLVNDTTTYFCVKTADNANATQIVEDIIHDGGFIAVYNEKWDSVFNRVNDYVSDTNYKMQRSIDTMLAVLTVGSIIGAFSVYAVEGLRDRRREIALLRSVGAAKNTIILAQGAEMLILVLFSLGLLLIYSPLFLSTSVTSAGGSTSGSYEIYPISVFPIIPWLTILTVLAFFIIAVAIFIIVIAALSSKINLAESLNAAWSEAGPYGGEV